ncbi:egg cell-secreted protein 1.3-like [Rhodamnia argentea]|uniref:Egg cell-secreted protein 1.3-like n=1 Tax=Rhodamnia argentea TaxID=178133 RepID=A0A8B8N1K7_9MYRT|nr:egg cell-secreted protein 1.3-like [Rhodamnia argentea]
MALKCLFLLIALAIIAADRAAAHNINVPIDLLKPGLDLAARLEAVQASGGLVECWNALVELKSCTNEIILFFLNGETSLGPGCCGAIDVITHNCWPAMLTSLGFTVEEGNILRRYCDAAAGAVPVASPTPSLVVGVA